MSSSHTPQALSLKSSPLIAGTILSFYLALTLPLPLLAQQTQAPLPPWLLVIALLVGGLILLSTLSYRVELNQQGMAILYPAWVPHVLQRQWSVQWSEITNLQPRGTSQGGLVYYLLTNSGTAYLLPMRVAGFSQMLQFIHTQTGLDTKLIRPLAQPWMYGLLGLFALLMFAIDTWILIAMQPWPGLG